MKRLFVLAVVATLFAPLNVACAEDVAPAAGMPAPAAPAVTAEQLPTAAQAPGHDAAKPAITSDGGKYQYEEGMPPAEATAVMKPEPADELGKPGITADHKPYIAIVIDDMGVDQKRSARAMDKLPPEVTLSFLPYSPRISEQTQKAYNLGHEIMVHMPMEAERRGIDPGPNALTTDLSIEEVKARTLKNLDAFKFYVGVNNHMGSKFTQDRTRLGTVMDELAPRHLFFLDSLTAPESVAESVARDHGLPTTHRDVFIDHFENAPLVAQFLNRIEYVGRTGGSVVAIGHPKDVTLDALEKWLPTLKAKGFELVPLSKVIDLRQRMPAPASHEKPARPQVAAATVKLTPQERKLEADAATKAVADKAAHHAPATKKAADAAPAKELTPEEKAAEAVTAAAAAKTAEDAKKAADKAVRAEEIRNYKYNN
ncbi:MAG: divergent polysaccharide deacetylase family protein [Micavibrio sp.]|nr:divergent polysaccharide deacetylase family protein [Micavibrio sp.]